MGSRLLHRLLNLSIFYKILIANSVIVIIGAAGGTWFTRLYAGQSATSLVLLYGLIGVTLTIAINSAILSAALQPLRLLQRTVDQVYRGNLEARAVKALIGDPVMNRLCDALNSTLDRLQASQHELQAMPARILSAQEEERKRVARELHDQTGQVLTSLMLGLKALEKAGDLDDVRRRTAELRDMASETLEAIHQLAVELRPAALDELGLVPALRAYVREYQAKSGIAVKFTVGGAHDRVPPQAEVALYRVVQEALTNVAKHAHATSVEVELQQGEGWLGVTVRDNGCGFPVEEVLASPDGGLGLFGMRERMLLIGGEWNIESRVGEGTVVRVRSPLASPPVAPVLSPA